MLPPLASRAVRWRASRPTTSSSAECSIPRSSSAAQKNTRHLPGDRDRRGRWERHPDVHVIPHAALPQLVMRQKEAPSKGAGGHLNGRPKTPINTVPFTNPARASRRRSAPASRSYSNPPSRNPGVASRSYSAPRATAGNQRGCRTPPSVVTRRFNGSMAVTVSWRNWTILFEMYAIRQPHGGRLSPAK